MAVYNGSKEKTNGTRLARLLFDEGTHVLREFLYSFHPRDKLQIVLNNNRTKLRSRVMFDKQWDKLFPPLGDPPDSDTFDISLLHLLIREICHLTAPLTGWHKMPTENDDSVEANLARIKCFRNELCHGASTGVPNDEFEEKWKQISSCLEALEVNDYRQRIKRLKSDPIDHDIQRLVEEQVNQCLEQLDHGLLNFEAEQESIKVRSCLPDEIPEELMFGRLHEIQQVREAIQSGSVSVVWITGGPGFGKTTVANKAAYELSRLDCERAILFCSFRSTKSFHDAATLMTFTCSKNHTQPPENPQHWLLNWSKQQSKVTFVLDNADEVLEDSDCINDFLNLLENMRRLSRQNVTFIVTSRTACSTSSPPSKNVRLACLPAEEAKQILLSRVPDLQNRAKLSKVEKLVEHCGFVPLALCIAGSLLSDYNEDELIKSLEDEPSNVLQVGRRSTDQTSVEKSIKRSFEMLHEVEQKALVLLCVFPGSFNSNVATSLITSCTTNATESVSVLQELKDRSLVEQLRPCRYQVHQLIQTFVQKIASDKYPGLLDRGKKLACAHFISRLADNANLYWSKDTCKQSVESFNEDRHNFEHFLQVYADMRREIEEQEIVKYCKTFLDDLPQKCMYIEKCVLPRFYISVLEILLETFHSESQPVHRVELLCILGHESRKKGDRKNYQEFMREAEEVHTKNLANFETQPLSETYFRNSCARFFSEKKDPLENKRIEQETKAALKVSCENLGDHPETAATLLFAGRIANRRKKYDEAEQKFFEALELFKKCLGKHFMTAETLKAIADLHAGKKGETELDKSLAHYAEAIEIFEDLAFRQSKECILTLKNFGMCHMRKGNLDEAMALLTEADEVGEKELEPLHTWKVKTKIALATLHDKMGTLDQAKAVMQEGYSMGKKLNLEIDEMGNKFEILEFIHRNPQTFPEIEFPSR